MIAAQAFPALLPPLAIEVGGALALLLAVLSGTDYVLSGTRLAAQRKREQDEAAATPARQLPLGLTREDPCVFENFYNGSNAEVVSALRGFIEQQARPAALAMGRSRHRQDPSSAGNREGRNRRRAVVRLHAGPRRLQARRPGRLAQDRAPVHRRRRPPGGRAGGGGKRWAACAGNWNGAVPASCWRHPARPPARATSADDMRTRLASGQIWKLRPLSDEERLEAVQLRVRSRGIRLPRSHRPLPVAACQAQSQRRLHFWWTAWPRWPRPAASSSPCPSCAWPCAKAWCSPAPAASSNPSPRVRLAAPPARPRAAGRKADPGGR